MRQHGTRARWPPTPWHTGPPQIKSYNTFTAISKFPWLKALAARYEIGTWFSGAMFVDAATTDAPMNDPSADGRLYVSGELWNPTEGSVPDGFPFRLLHHEGVEDRARSRGWQFPHLTDQDPWPTPMLDERFRFDAFKRQPNSEPLLVHGRVRFGQEPYGKRFVILDPSGRTVAELPRVRNVDWTPEGRLLVATVEGALEIRELHGARVETVWRFDTAPMTPEPGPAPEWAHSW